MTHVAADPAALYRFAQQLTRYVALLRQENDAMDRRFALLGSTWRDDEQRQFAEEYVAASRQLRHFCELAESHAPFLTRKAIRLDAYFGVAGGGSAGTAGGGSAGTAGGGSGNPLRIGYDPHAVMRREVFSAVRQIMPQHTANLAQQTIAANTSWIEVDRLPTPDPSTGHKFSHISEAQCTEHLRRLVETIEPWIAAGAVHDDFVELDRRLQLENPRQDNYADTYANTFDLFFRSEPIAVGLGQDTASVPTPLAVGGGSINAGGHFITLARKLGIPRLPVRVVRR
jgi:hypothetical protein